MKPETPIKETMNIHWKEIAPGDRFWYVYETGRDGCIVLETRHNADGHTVQIYANQRMMWLKADAEGYYSELEKR